MRFKKRSSYSPYRGNGAGPPQPRTGSSAYERSAEVNLEIDINLDECITTSLNFGSSIVGKYLHETPNKRNT
jgi:hypothetical protein